VTHPFHPLSGQRLEIVAAHHNWHEDRVCYREGKRLFSLPLRWTSLAPADPFALVSAGRAWFRADDLLRLAELVESLRGGERTRGATRHA